MPIRSANPATGSFGVECDRRRCRVAGTPCCPSYLLCQSARRRFQFSAHKTYNPGVGVIFSGRDQRHTNRCARRAVNQSNRLCELPAVNRDSRPGVLGNGDDPVTDVDVLLSGCGQTRNNLLDDDVIPVHPQLDADEAFEDIVLENGRIYDIMPLVNSALRRSGVARVSNRIDGPVYDHFHVIVRGGLNDHPQFRVEPGHTRRGALEAGNRCSRWI